MEAFAHEVAAYPNAARLVLVEPSMQGRRAVARTERTRRLVERVVSLRLREDPGALMPSPVMPSPVIVKRVVADGARAVRAGLLDGHPAELELLAEEIETVSCARTSRGLA